MKRIDKNVTKLNAGYINRKYEIEAIWNSVVDVKELESVHLVELYNQDL